LPVKSSTFYFELNSAATASLIRSFPSAAIVADHRAHSGHAANVISHDGQSVESVLRNVAGGLGGRAIPLVRDV